MSQQIPLPGFSDQIDIEFENQLKIRKKPKKDELILTVENDFLLDNGYVGVFSNVSKFITDIRRSNSYVYVDRNEAECREDVKQIVTYTLLVSGSNILSYRRGVYTNAAEELEGQRSIGFGGHVDFHDCDMLNKSNMGIMENARRELSEELLFTESEMRRLCDSSYFVPYCIVNTYQTDQARKHIGFVFVYSCSPEFSARKGELSINQVKWISYPLTKRRLDGFEPWSKSILEYLGDGVLGVNDQ